MKTLLVMRHAKSDWAADHDSDHDRPLNERGIRSARIIGRLLAAEDHIPDLVVSSTAQRARSTAHLAGEAGDWGGETVLEPALYGSGANAAVEVASSAPDIARLMLVGHQPAWSTLVFTLTGRRVEMKTGTVAVIALEIEAWSEITSTRGTLANVYQPRDYFDTRFDPTGTPPDAG